MTLPEQVLISDLLRQNVRCNNGIDHGPGVFAWMHPPVHRILGWASRPSVLSLSRSVWRLDQLKGIGENQIFVKGSSESTDQATLERLPTLLEAEFLNSNGKKIGNIVDFIFQPVSGEIKYYLVSRTDPRIPGTSRWRLNIKHILDQQPGMVSCDFDTLDDLPLFKASIRQDLIKKSRRWRDQISEISSRASDRLEGWLEESSWEKSNDFDQYTDIDDDSINDDWVDNDLNLKNSKDSRLSSRRIFNDLENEEDPWV